MAMNRLSIAVLGAFHVLMIVLFAVFTKYNKRIHQNYSMWQDVQVMIHVGFGFLMSFLTQNGFTATGNSFVISGVAFLWAVLNLGFWPRVLDDNTKWDKIEVGLEELARADFCVAAILISFGALIGRVSLVQMLVLTVVEVVVYSFNEALGIFTLQAADIGGGMIIHLFGAYFGLAASYVLGRKPDHRDKDESLNRSTATSDTFAMVGTLFLWCFWPSFNAFYTSGEPERATRAIVNTWLSISSSAIAAFYVCALMQRGKFRMVEVQNATLAGGVAMGAVADMFIEPFGAMLLGSIAGVLSVVGFQVLSPLLLAKFGLKDTCGVHNLHGMPGMLSALASVIAARLATAEDYGWQLLVVFPKRDSRSASEQAAYQLAFLGTTLGLAIGGGALAGFLMRQCDTLEAFYTDKVEWVQEEADEDNKREKSNGSQVNLNAGL